MSNLTSTVPATFNAFYNLLITAGNAQSPTIPVFHSEVLSGQQTQNGYVVLEGVANHRFEAAALGSFAHYEKYDVHGLVVFYQGGPDPTTLVENVLNQTWSIYQNVVMKTAVQYSGSPPSGGGQILGSQAPTQLEWFKPVVAQYTGGEPTMGGDPSGFQGQVEFAYNAYARITVP